MDRFEQDRFRRISRRLVILFSFLFLEVQMLWGQRLEWTISPALPKAGEPFTLHVRFPGRASEVSGIPGEVIPIKEDFFPPSLQLFKGPLLETRRERVGEKLSEILLVSYIFIAQRAGRFRLDPLQIKIGEQEYRVEPFLVEVVQKDLPHRVPFELDWILPKGPFYVGQVIPLQLVAKDLKELRSPEVAQVEPTSAGILEKVSNLSGREPDKGQDGWVVSTIGQYLYTPYREGSQFLPSATVRIEGIEQKLEGKKVSILPLPLPVKNGSGAVGSFSIKAFLDDTSIPEGSVTTLRIRIEGKGNLHWVKAPSIQVEGCSLIFGGRRSHYTPTGEGYEGWIEEAYQLTPKRTGALTIRIQPFSFWDPFRQKTQELSLPPLTIQVRESRKTDQGDPPKQVTLNPLPEDLRVSGWTTWFHRPVSYVLLLPAIVGMVGMYRRKRGKFLLYCVGWILCVGVLVLPFSDFFEADPRGLIAVKEFNEAVRQGRKGEWGEALFHLRKASTLSPDPVFRESVRKVEDAFGHTFRAPLPRTVPDTWFLWGIGAFHLIAIGTMVQKSRRRRGWVLGIGVSALLLSSVGLYSSLSDLRKPWGVVVASNAVLHTVPSPLAREGIPLPPGSSFYVGTETGEYVFVFLEGVKGWVEKKNLRRE